MNRPKSKLMAAVFLTLASISLIITVSYAWVTLSGKPALTGVEINIGGSNTIQIAADMTRVVDGVTVHYPGKFQETFQVMEHPMYSYLNNLAGLSPVSTADGLNWFMASADAEMELKGSYSLSDYTLDNKLSYGNIPASSSTGILSGESGHYAYMDFWLVSPMDDCNVRVSIGSQVEGSYVIALPNVTKDGNTMTGYALEEGNDQVAACVRVGFLVNTDEAADSLAVYKNTGGYSLEYKSLKGIYQAPGSAYDNSLDYQFTIYEPNGDSHNTNGVSYVQTENGLTYVECKDGDYVVTNPIGYENDKVSLINISRILTVQKTNTWRQAADGTMLMNQIFQSAMLNRDLTDMTQEEIMQNFYFDTWKNGYPEQVVRAGFWENTRELYLAGLDGVTSAENMKTLSEGNVTTGAIIVNLEKNVPQRVRMFVWLEGQDVDCVREAALETFAIGIELAGSTLD